MLQKRSERQRKQNAKYKIKNSVYVLHFPVVPPLMACKSPFKPKMSEIRHINIVVEMSAKNKRQTSIKLN